MTEWTAFKSLLYAGYLYSLVLNHTDFLQWNLAPVVIPHYFGDCPNPSF